jgi:hypothetical protein
MTRASVYVCLAIVVALAGTLLPVYSCSATVMALAGTLAVACACGAAMSTPAIAIAGAALYAVSAAFCTCDGLLCLPVRLIFRGRRCLCDEFTALPYSFHARRNIVSNGQCCNRHLLTWRRSSSS